MIFQDETPRVLEGWDGRIHMVSVEDKLDWMELTQPLPCGDTFIHVGYQWDGASVGPFRRVPFLHFPKWKHPIATCRHDIRCQLATTREQRKIADQLFKKDVADGGTWWEKTKGYRGVRIGAFFSYLFK